MKRLAIGSVLSAIATVVLLAGCTTKPAAPEAPPGPPPMTQAAPQSQIVPGSIQDFRVNVGDTIHFSYDRSDLVGDDQNILQRQAAWLEKYPQVRVQVQGNCDERGTEEYNLALGARRANAAKEYLVSLGVAADRIDTISFGKERPVCTESTEECWAQNRRDVTVIMSGATS